MKKYTDKEIAVFKGVLKLSSEGKNMYIITVQNIADAAGIGKGTIYDYFSSKEEIIIKSILYYAYHENEMIKIQTNKKDTFQDKMYCVYDIIFKTIDNRLSTLHLLVTIGSINKVENTLCAQKQEYSEIMQDSVQIFGEILQKGVQEGVIQKNDDIEYLKSAITSNMVMIAMRIMENRKATEQEKIKKDAYKMLIKMLN